MPSPLASCAVCGTPTTSRCSGCANAGGPSIFFCSPEHQRLVWHNHKFVCRENSARFVVPPLTKAELARMDEIMDRPLPDPSLTAAFHSDRLLTLRDVIKMSPVLQGGLPALAHPEDPASPETQSLLRKMRALGPEFYRKVHGREEVDLDDQSPWEFVVEVQDLAGACFEEQDGPVDSNTLVNVGHCALILHTLVSLKRGTDPVEIPDSWILTAIERLFAALNDDLHLRRDQQDAFDQLAEIVAYRLERVIEFTVLTEWIGGSGFKAHCEL